MPRAELSIIIHDDLGRVFAVTSDIERWPELFQEFRDARVLSTHRSGWFARLDFELTDTAGKTWQLWCVLDYKAHIAIIQHAIPFPPFRSLHLAWHYKLVETGVRMTWIQDFELSPDAAITDAQALASVLDSMTTAQRRCKQLLEAQPCTKR